MYKALPSVQASNSIIFPFNKGIDDKLKEIRDVINGPDDGSTLSNPVLK